ncbi:MAG: N-acetyl-gamma-glutamyl-phosphate reductase, partial [Polyangiales bacterium]
YALAMDRIRVGIVGASGYSGTACARILASHPRASIAFATSDKWAGDEVRARLGAPIDSTLVFVPNRDAIEHARAVDAVLLATPAETSMQLAPAFLDRHVSVVDLSGAFRLGSAEAYPTWYGHAHSSPSLLGRAHYGLPELFGPPRFGADGTALIANPGCYPTAATLALGPLLRAGLIRAEGIIVDAKSGVSGAGRQAREEYSFVELERDVRAYKLLAHQHTPEIARSLGRMLPEGPSDARVTFTPHLVPVSRGILATCYARPVDDTTVEELRVALAEAYDGATFVRVTDPAAATLNAVVGTNDCVLGVTGDDDVVIVTAAIDNLIKGAAGQAVQNLNLLYGLPEGAGLDRLLRHAC